MTDPLESAVRGDVVIPMSPVIKQLSIAGRAQRQAMLDAAWAIYAEQHPNRRRPPVQVSPSLKTLIQQMEDA